VKPDAPGAASAIELRFSAQGKKDAIDAGYYEATAFDGNRIKVASAQTVMDIERVLTDNDSSPDTLCYSGDTTTAKKILWSMLGNTDGNGDHWLDEGAKITGGAARRSTSSTASRTKAGAPRKR
jgi:hypothetical protein